MKINYLKSNLFLAFIVSGFVFISCEDTNSLDEQADLLTEDEAITMVESDDISDEVDNIVDDYLSEDFDVASKDEASKNDEAEGKGGRPDCAIKTIVIDGSSKIVTLDFGEGCELPNGNILAGQIIMSYLFDKDAKTTSVTQSFKNFSVNDVTIDGENTIVRTKENENGNPQSVKTMNVTHTWADGETSIKKGTKTREFILGSDTRTWGDNVYLISGGWSNTFKSGTTYSSTITNSLRREMACRFIVSGTVDVVKSKRLGAIDFGDGACDNGATFIDADGVVTEIVLRKRMK